MANHNQQPDNQDQRDRLVITMEMVAAGRERLWETLPEECRMIGADDVLVMALLKTALSVGYCVSPAPEIESRWPED